METSEDVGIFRICATVSQDDFEFNVVWEGLAPLPRRIAQGPHAWMFKKWKFTVQKMAKGSSEEPIHDQWSIEENYVEDPLMNIY